MQSDDFIHEILTSIKEVVSDLKADIKEIKHDINEIKLDVNHHILRTDLLEEEKNRQAEAIESLKKDTWKFKGALGLLGFLLTLLATYQIFKH